MCPKSHVMGFLSHVRCQGFFFYKKVQSGGASRWKVCYQRGLPRLFYMCLIFHAPQLSFSHKCQKCQKMLKCHTTLVTDNFSLIVHAQYNAHARCCINRQENMATLDWWLKKYLFRVLESAFFLPCTQKTYTIKISILFIMLHFIKEEKKSTGL